MSSQFDPNCSDSIGFGSSAGPEIQVAVLDHSTFGDESSIIGIGSKSLSIHKDSPINDITAVTAVTQSAVISPDSQTGEVNEPSAPLDVQVGAPQSKFKLSPEAKPFKMTCKEASATVSLNGSSFQAQASTPRDHNVAQNAPRVPSPVRAPPAATVTALPAIVAHQATTHPNAYSPPTVGGTTIYRSPQQARPQPMDAGQKASTPPQAYRPPAARGASSGGFQPKRGGDSALRVSPTRYQPKPCKVTTAPLRRGAPPGHTRSPTVVTAGEQAKLSAWGAFAGSVADKEAVAARAFVASYKSERGQGNIKPVSPVMFKKAIFVQTGGASKLGGSRKIIKTKTIYSNENGEMVNEVEVNGAVPVEAGRVEPPLTSESAVVVAAPTQVVDKNGDLSGDGENEAKNGEKNGVKSGDKNGDNNGEKNGDNNGEKSGEEDNDKNGDSGNTSSKSRTHSDETWFNQFKEKVSSSTTSNDSKQTWSAYKHHREINRVANQKHDPFAFTSTDTVIQEAGAPVQESSVFDKCFNASILPRFL